MPDTGFEAVSVQWFESLAAYDAMRSAPGATELRDLDLSYRAQLKGWRAAYLEDLVRLGVDQLDLACEPRVNLVGADHVQDHHVGPNGAAQCFAMGRRALIGERRRGGGGSSVIGVGGWVEEAQAGSLLWVVFKILWLLTGLGACEPTGLFDPGAMFPHCTNRR